jgi:hypothetical protein
LNPVTDVTDSVKRGLVAIRTPIEMDVANEKFKKILLTDATTEEGENKVAEYFKVQLEWEGLLLQWEEEHKNVSGFKRYYELLYLVKSKSKVDKIWFSFFEGMHRHAAIVAGLVCSRFNHSTNELELGSLKLEDFNNDSVIKSFNKPNITVEEQLDRIFKKLIDAPMFTNEFPLSVYIPKTMHANENAAQLIEGAKLQSSWISNFKMASARTTLSKNIANWGKTIQMHSTGQTRSNTKYRPRIEDDSAYTIVPQTDTRVTAFKTTMERDNNNDDAKCYGCPMCIRSEAWDAYINNPFDTIARKAWVKTITFGCIDEKKKSDMAPPFGITYESVTKDLGKVVTKHGPRKVDVRLYNGYLLIPGIVYHLSAKTKSVRVNELFGNKFEVNVINFVARYGIYTRKSPFLKIHGAYSKYIEMTDPTYINGCTGNEQIIPVYDVLGKALQCLFHVSKRQRNKYAR